MKTKAFVSMAMAFGLVTTVFAGLSIAGEALTVVGTTQFTPGVDDASVEAWNLDITSLEIVTDIVGVNGQSGAPEMWMYNVGNWATPWADGATDRSMIAKTVGDRGWACSNDLVLVSGAGIQMVTTDPIAEMVMPYDADKQFVAQVDLLWPDPGDPRIVGYLVYRSIDNATWTLIDGTVGVQAGLWWSNPCPLERATAWNAGLAFTDLAPVPAVSNFYCLRYVYGSPVDGFGVPTQEHFTAGNMDPTGNFVPVYSCGFEVLPQSAGTPPEITASTSDGTLHNGDHTNELVTLTGTADDTMHSGAGEPDDILSCEIQITSPTPITYGPFAMNLVLPPGDNPIEDFTYDWNFPTGIPEGVYGYEMRATDVQGANASWDGDGYTFTIADTVAPTFDYNAFSTPDGAVRALGTPCTISLDYEDFTAYQNAILYYWNPAQGEAFRANNIVLNNVSWWAMSHNNRLQNVITTYGAVGDFIFYEADVQDSSAGGPITVTSAQRFIEVGAAAIAPGDPYPIYGYTLQYDGNSAIGWNPMLIPGCTVTVTWWNTSVPAGWSTITTVSNGLAQFSVDILNYTDLDFVFVNVTANPVYGNLGYNWTQIDVVGFPGGRWQNVICGVPWNVTITDPIPMAMQYGATPFPVTYNITDRNGVITPGYYTYGAISPDRGFFNITCGPVLPAPHFYTAPADQIFDGTASPTPGGFTGLVTIFSPNGLWWINASEGGQIFPDTLYLTDWDAWFLDPFLTIPGWLKDWDNITIQVQVGGFDWLLTQGWNQVSCPQNATYRQGLNLFFDSQDAMNWTRVYMNVNYGVDDPALSMADRTGGNPSTYQTYDVDTGEPAAWAVDTVHGYWVYTSQPGPYVIHFDAQNATTTGINTQDVTIDAGWNLLGFQHNYTGLVGWGVIPTASMFTDGTVAPFLWMGSLGGARTKLVATQWTIAKWYDSYVVDDTPPGFPGMPAHNWVWDFSYSQNPGNGYWLWSDAAGVATYSVLF
jgi:hypothetical protein